MRRNALIAGAALLLAGGAVTALTLGGAQAGPSGCDPQAGSCVLVAPGGARAYHAAFPDFGGSEDQVEAKRLRRFERAAGRPVAWAYLSNNWYDGEIRFPSADVEVIDREGRVPFVRLMARSGDGHGRDPNFSMRSIAEGGWDADIAEWCRDAAETQIPLLAEFGTEVNGEWFPWNGRWNGGGRRGWGDPGEADGPERFRAAYRRIVETCHAEGADDITWFFHVDVGGWPETAWNDGWDYYPGDDVVDWVGLSDYGPLKPGQPWESFHLRMDAFIHKLLAHIGDDKPLAVLEYGAAAADGPAQQARKARWIERAANLVAEGHWPEIRALAYWHESWKNGDGSVSDLHIDSSRRVRNTYRRALGGDAFTSEPEFAERWVSYPEGSARAPSAMNGQSEEPGVGSPIPHSV